MNRWQYQSKAEPVSTLGENITLDKWYRPALDIVRKKGVSSALLAGALFFVPVVVAAETVTLDKWNTEVSQPQFVRSSAQSESTFFVPIVSAPEVVTLDKWYQPLATPPSSVKRHTYTYPSFEWITNTFVETITMDKWFRETSQPLFAKPRASFFNYTLTDPDILTQPGVVETVTLDKWYVPIYQPYVPSKNLNHLYKYTYQPDRLPSDVYGIVIKKSIGYEYINTRIRTKLYIDTLVTATTLYKVSSKTIREA